MNSERSNFIVKIQDSAEKVASIHFDPKPWESEKMYEAMGVRQFQAILKKSRDLGLKEINNKNPVKELRFGYIAESIHTLGLVPSLYALSLGIQEGNPLLAASATIPTLMNIYPVFSQRYN